MKICQTSECFECKEICYERKETDNLALARAQMILTIMDQLSPPAPPVLYVASRRTIKRSARRGHLSLLRR